MSVVPLTVEIISMFVLAAFLIHKYGNVSRQHVAVTISVLVAWYFSFIIIFILPLDVSSTIYRQCIRDTAISTLSPETTTSLNISFTNITYLNITTTENSVPTAGHSDCVVPWSHIPESVLPNLWRIVYWTSQLLTWIILPLMQSYSQAGDFTVAGKLKSALVGNAIYYGSYLLIFGVLLIYIAARPDLDLDAGKLKIICITASNTWGLFLLVLLLGYGLVEVPRTCWNSAKRGYMLNYTYFKASKLSTEKLEAEESLEDTLEDIQKAAETITIDHPLRKCLETILEKCPENVQQRLFTTNPRSDDVPATYVGSEKCLVRLHRQLIKSLKTHKRTQTQWNSLVDRALQLEDVARNEGSNERYFKTSSVSIENASHWIRVFYTPTIEWYWKCVIRSWLLRILAVLMVIMSAIVVWSEVTFFNHYPVLSLFAVFLDLAKSSYNYLQIEMVSIITLAYLCVCTYYTVFKIRILNYYYLAPGHQTDEYSLIFSGMLLCRLTPPMCLNFLGLIHLDSHVTWNHNMEETSYTQIMGHLDMISFISDGVNIYLPILILILCLATYFSLGSRFLHMLGFQQFIGDDDMTCDLIDEGRELIRREKRKKQRTEENINRRKQFNDKLSGSAIYRNSRSLAGKSRSGLRRDDSTESTHAELLRDVEPVDYTGQCSPRDSATRLYQSEAPADENRWTYSPRNWTNRPPRGIFDDV